MPPTLTIQLLSEFRLFENERPIETPIKPRQQALLAYLLLHRHAPQPRQQMAFTFWPDLSERQAYTNLRKLFFQLRQVLPEADAFLTADTYSLGWRQDAPYVLDVAQLEQALDKLAQSDVPPVAAVEQVVALYRGELLPTCYEDWLLPIRRSLHERVVDRLTQAVMSLEAQHEYATALRAARHLLRLDPLHEAAYRQLMHLQALAGDRAGALRTYHHCTTLLEQELGVPPAAETQALYQHLLRSEAQVDPASAPAPVQHHRHVPLVGRKQEWQQLQQAWQQMAQRGPHMVTVWGEAGMGKTRLVEELMHWARLRPGTVAYARAYAAEGLLSYAPLTEWLRSEAIRAGLVKLEPVWLSEIARLLPELLTENIDLPPPLPMRESWQRQRFHEALARAVPAASRPQVLVLDDLQWCDGETLAWLRYLLRFAEQAPLLVVGTARSEAVEEQHPLHELRRSLQRSGQWTEFELTPLNVAETCILAGYLTEQDVTRSSAQLFRETEGNPLFVVEMVRAGLLFGKSTGQPEGAVSLPPTLQAVIEERLAQLSPPARQLARFAATIGRAFSVEVLAAATELDEDALVQGLDELWQRRILRERGQRYDFSHDKIRDIVYSQPSQARRRLLHQRIGTVLLQLYADKLDAVAGELAEHAERAGQTEQALSYQRQAAQVAQARGAYPEVVTRLHKGLALLQSLSLPSDVAMRQELAMLVFLGTSLVALRGYGDAEVEATFKRALHLCTQLGEDPNLMPTLVGLGRFYMIRGEVRQALAIGQQGMHLAQRAQDAGLLLQAHLILGPTLQYLGDLRGSVAHLEQTVGLYDPVLHGDHAAIYGDEPAVAARVIGAISLYFLGHAERSLRWIEEGLALAQQSSHAFSLNLAQVYASALYYVRREPAAVLPVAEDGIKLARQHGYDYWLVICTMFQCWAAVHLEAAGGKPTHETQAVLAQMKEAFFGFRRSGAGVLLPHYLSVMAEAQMVAGDREAAWATIHEALEVAKTVEDVLNRPTLHHLHGELLLAGLEPGQPAEPIEAEAEAAFRLAIETAQAQAARMLELRAATSLARLWLRQGRQMEAHALLEPLFAWFTEGFDTPDLLEARALLDCLSSA